MGKEREIKSSDSMSGPGAISIVLYSTILAFFSYTVVLFSRTRFPSRDYLTVADVFDVVAPYIVMFFYVYFYYKCREKDIINLILRADPKKENLSIIRNVSLFHFSHCLG